MTMHLRGHRPILILVTILISSFFSACSKTPATATLDPSLSPQEQEGQRLFTIHCASCHEAGSDTVIVGPSLAGIAVRAGTRVSGQDTASYIRNSILNPYQYLVVGFTETMPPDFGKRLTGEEFDAVVAYLLTLD